MSSRSKKKAHPRIEVEDRRGTSKHSEDAMLMAQICEHMCDISSVSEEMHDLLEKLSPKAALAFLPISTAIHVAMAGLEEAHDVAHGLIDTCVTVHLQTEGLVVGKGVGKGVG